ncbi:uncharacterized protein LOC118268876 [Spodoptera frugiperda]|uniref:Uncharacterized protein LOC118268876 n=1 Tax=Spodoptera frugiperda TaxID=7108 RepID=A0A9R0DZS6_SPOFR|nr:uncharacterized protein LOC118268876 [Spodoptera frugiperda]
MLVVNLILILVILQELHYPPCVAVPPENVPPFKTIVKHDPRVAFYAKMGWKKTINPWMAPIYHMEAYIHRCSNVVLFVININNYSGSNREQTIITTGVFISSTRVLTSFNPFKKYLQDAEVVNKTIILSPHYFWHNKKYGHAYVAPRVDTIECGRQIMPLPDDADVLYVNKEKISPLHDLMVFRITEPKEFLPPRAYSGYVNFSPQWRFWNMSVPGLPLASPLDDIFKNRIVRIVGFGFINETEFKKEHKRLHEVLLHPNPVDILDCDSWIPREWGYFICVRNFFSSPALPSGAVLQSYSNVYGIGSFTLTRNGESIFVFTDVRPYRNQILHACSIYEFEDTPDPRIWW